MDDLPLLDRSVQLGEAAREIIRRCRRLAACTEEPGHITRTFLSPPMHEVHRQVRQWMEEAGMSVRVDAAGNIRGTSGRGPRLMIASHLDTVPHAGAFDGILGVLMGIALVGLGSTAAIEVAGFSEEEGVRFRTPFIGSRALVRDPVMDAPVLEAIRAFGLDPAHLPAAAIGDDVHAYLEFHIEQGPVLEKENQPVGVVAAIVGQSRYEVSFHGKANHAGATPMNQRSDALAAAAEWIGTVERIAQDTPDLVATVGRIEMEPGASNVIPGMVRASLDVRSSSDSTRSEAVARMLGAAGVMRGWRPVTATYENRMDQPAVPMDPELVRTLSAAVKAAGHRVHSIVSGAGHDAMILARKVPAAMLLLRTPGGLSHHPDETVLPEDVEAALAVGLRFLDIWRPS